VLRLAVWHNTAPPQWSVAAPGSQHEGFYL
jgi:hypothetical protein